MKDTHPKSSKSIEPYFENLWNFVKDYDYKIIGKPFGIKPMLKAFGIENYNSVGIEHDKIDFIDYADYTLGNSLGIAEGISISKPNSKIFVFISDAQLNMGNMIESIISVPYFCKNILLCIDYNKSGSRGKLLIDPVFDVFRDWNISHIYDNSIGRISVGNNVWIYHSYNNILDFSKNF